MKLAEALSLRADLQKSIGQLKSRLKECSKIQEGDVPSEDPQDLLAALEKKYPELESLIFRINYTNMNTMQQDGMSLTCLIARKDILTLKISTMREVLKYATEREDRYSRSEIKYVCLLDVAVIRKQTDALSQELRLLDIQIQRLNWSTDLL